MHPIPLLLRSLSVLGSFFLLTATLSAQDFTALDGYSAARAEAEDQLNDNVTLLAVGTSGESQFSGLSPGFDFESGKSFAWVYLFEGNETDTAITILVFRLFTYVAQPISEVNPLAFANFIPGLDLDAPYADSDLMVRELAGNATFQGYRQDYPSRRPEVVGLGRVADGSRYGLPSEFPLGSGAWVMLFTGSGDSAMTCFVSASTGQDVCFRITSSVPEEREDLGSLSTRWEDGHLWIDLLDDLVRMDQDIEFAIYDLAGNLVHSSRFENVDRRSLLTSELDLPSGRYLLRLSSAHYSGIARFSVIR